MRSKFKWIFTLILALSMQFSFAQEKTVTGVVSDATGTLPGANVVVKGTTNGVQTDMDGKYSIKVKAGDVLVFSFVGLADSTVKVGASNSVNVKMQESGVKLNEVVVGALGIKRTKASTASAQQNVTSKEINQAASPNVIQSLAGKVTGLQINTTSNGANPNSSIVLRGNRTITGNNQALVVIDGAISTATILQQLPPELIEAVNVIKGSQGAALYGEQGSNGVLIVTTKRGAKSKLEISISSTVDFQEVSYLPKRQTKYGQGWVNGSYDAVFPGADPRNSAEDTQYSPYENGAWGPAFNNPAWAGTTVPVGLPQADGTIFQSQWKSLGSDNIKDFFKTGTILQNNITINSGDENGYVMGTYSRQLTDFIVDQDGLKRNYFMFKAGKKAGKWKVDGTVSYTNQKVTTTDSNLLYELLQTPTNVDINLFRNSGTLHHWTSFAQNPWQIIKQKRFNTEDNNFSGILRLEYELDKHISVLNTANVQINSSVSDDHNDGFNADANFDYLPFLTGSTTTGTYQNNFGGSSQNELSSFHMSTFNLRNIYNDLIFNFDYDLNSKLNFKANLGANVQDRYTIYTQQGGDNLKIPGWYNIQNVSNPDRITSLSNGHTVQRKVASFINVDFDYNKYLFLNLTDRVEQSSLIARKTYNYYSAGLSFVPTEAFPEFKSDVLNFAKFYANYSKVGNTTSVGPYAITDVSLGASGYPFQSGGIIAYTPRTALVNPNINPEFVFSKEIGGQLGFFTDRITLDGSYYINDTKGLITNATTSSTAYASTILSNTGKLQNKGYELGLGLTPFKSENGFNWNIRTGFTKYKTIVKELSPGINEVNLLSGTGVGLYAVVGEEFPSIKTTQYATDADGHIIVGSNGIPTSTSTLQTVGHGNPEYIINLSNTFGYRGIALTVVGDYRANYSIYSETYNRMLFAGYTLDSAEFDRDLGYLVPNSVVNTSLPSTPVYAPNTFPVGTSSAGVAPVGNAGLANYYSRLSSIGQYSLVDASAIKIREISLSYSLPSKYLKDTGISSFKFGINARNPFIIFVHTDDKYGRKNEGYTDPEASALSGVPGYSNVGQYPTTKTFGASINVTF